MPLDSDLGGRVLDFQAWSREVAGRIEAIDPPRNPLDELPGRRQVGRRVDLEHGVLDEWDYWAGTFGLVVFAFVEVWIVRLAFGVDEIVAVATSVALFWFGVDNYIVWGLLAGIFRALQTSFADFVACRAMNGMSLTFEKLSKPADIGSRSTEYDALGLELTNIMTNTKFGGQTLLTGGTLAAAVSFQIGADAAEVMTVNASANLTAVGTAITRFPGWATIPGTRTAS